MHQSFRPMLAATARLDDLKDLRYPVIATPKYDGIRCVLADLPNGAHTCVPLCRSLKPVPNQHISWALYDLPAGLDGEIMTYTAGSPDNFNMIQSKVMSFQGKPTFKYHVFDANIFTQGVPYQARLLHLIELIGRTLPLNVDLVAPKVCRSALELQEYVDDCLESGHEGVCFRTPESPYKYGRSTLKQQWLCKYKEFIDAEAEVVGAEELMGNENVPEINELGYQERSSHKAGMVPRGLLGALVVRDLVTSQMFKVGTGFSMQDRVQLWADARGPGIVGRIIKYRFQKIGMLVKPRIPAFMGFRDRLDMDAKPQQENLL